MTEHRKRRRPNRSGEQTRAALIEAARLEFLEAGYVGASLRRIARKAGVHQYSVRYHFGGKIDLYRALARTYIQEFLSSLQIDMDGDMESRALTLVKHYLTFIREHRTMPALTQRMMVERDPEAIEVMAEAVGPLLQMVRLIAPSGVSDAKLHATIWSVLGAIVAPYAYEPLISALGMRDAPDFDDEHFQIVNSLLREIIREYQSETEPTQ